MMLDDVHIRLTCDTHAHTHTHTHTCTQVVQFYSDRADLTSFTPTSRRPATAYTLNCLLPKDIRILQLTRTAPDFNVSISATAKTYHYHINTNTEADVFTHRYRMHCWKALDVERMRAAARFLEGTHNFTQLSNRADITRKRNPVKTLARAEVVELPCGLIRVEFTGSGFLYKMVRHMVGALVAVGLGQLEPEWVREQLLIGDSVKPGGARGHFRGYKVADSSGLFLHRIDYPPGVDDPSTLLYPDVPHDEWGRLLDLVPGQGRLHSGEESSG
jgi:tRNA pseudouridine38-40 synthase